MAALPVSARLSELKSRYPIAYLSTALYCVWFFALPAIGLLVPPLRFFSGVLWLWPIQFLLFIQRFVDDPTGWPAILGGNLFGVVVVAAISAVGQRAAGYGVSSAILSVIYMAGSLLAVTLGALGLAVSNDWPMGK